MNNSIISLIKELKIKKNAIILAHYYVDGEIQDIADYVGDSYYLSKVAADTNADIIVFCGVSFMGESAKILNPKKKVLMPDINSDCPMAHMCEISYIEKIRSEYDDLAVVCYINSTAELKACSDVCVTSSNALKIVKSLPNKNILFIPDKNLGHYISTLVPEKNFIFNQGYCPIHNQILTVHINEAIKLHPNAKILSHPECPCEVLDLSDFIGSTSEIIDYAKNSADKEFIVATETGVFHKLKIDNPDKTFYPVTQNQICNDMKYITLQKIYDCLLNETGEIKVPDIYFNKSLQALNKMLILGK